MSRAHDTAQSAVMQGKVGRGGRVTRIIGHGHISCSSQQGCVVAACVSEQRAEAGRRSDVYNRPADKCAAVLCPARRGGGASAAARSECGVWSVSGAETAGLPTCTVDRVAAAAVDSDTHRKYFLRSA